MDASPFYDSIRNAISREAEAARNLEFLFPNSSVTSFIGSPDFKASLHCSLESLVSIDTLNVSCVEACSNPAAIFSNWPNFYTCSWYPSLSEALVQPDVAPSTRDTFSALGILPNETSLSQSISSDIANCLSDYCASSDDCRRLDATSQSCSLETLVTRTTTSTTLNRTNAILCLRDNVCSSIGAVDPDIGGLGVISSLLIQYMLSILAIVSHFLFVLRYQLHRTLWLRRANTTRQDEELIVAKQTLRGNLEALTSALVEFQKAQCFFSATLQIAAIIVLPQYEIGEGSRDQILLRLTSANAFAPIILTLAQIDLLGGRNSKYLLFLSFLAFCLGSSTYWLSFPTSRGGNNFFQYEPPDVPIMSCNNKAPFAPCFLHNEFFFFSLWKADYGIFYAQPQKLGLAVWIITLSILLYRIINTLCNSGYAPLPCLQRVLDRVSFSRSIIGSGLSASPYKHRELGFSEALPITASSVGWREQTIIFMAKRRTWVFVQLILGTTALVMQLVSVIQVLQFSSGIISKQMSFGQIVAVGIWVPVLLEFAYLQISGAAKGTEYRLKASLVVNEKMLESTAMTPQIITRRETEVLDEDEECQRVKHTGG